ncbi:ComF family protein [Rhodoligotrophos defluvii]|uniref:ComF family protein n=1 Tax=Rhodoligotrophos defluvii TaxID=2561934 RepID=UPI0010C978C2|nr:ComF family protein [Rhodoligotrophos defluvii]
MDHAARWSAEFGTAARLALDLVLPPQCLCCKARTATPRSLCAKCWQGLTFLEPPLCDRLGIPFPYDQGEGVLSALALARPPLFARARGAVAYDEISRELVHAGKYRDRHDALNCMARMMMRAGRHLIADADLIVPVPLHWKRLWSRRYNQSAILARKIAKASGRSWAPRALKRVRATSSQVMLDERARRRNVRKAFAVPPVHRGLVAGKRVLLIDDVLTTGATSSACTKTLLATGASAVDVLVFALVLDPAHIHI